MRIVVLCSDPGVGRPGHDETTAQLAAISAACAASGHEVLQLCRPLPALPRGVTAPPHLAAALEATGAWGEAGVAGRLVAAVRPAVERFAPDVVYELAAPFGTAGQALARATGARHVLELARLHGDAVRPRCLRPLARRRERELLAAADLRVSTSRLVAEAADAIAPGTTLVVPGAVDPARFRWLPERRGARGALGLPQDARVACLVAGLLPGCGVEAAIGALARTPDLVLVVVGDGPLRLDLEALAATRGVGERVRFLGRLSAESTTTVLAAADLGLAPGAALPGPASVPQAVLEFLAAGLPIVGGGSAETRALLADEPSALLVPAGDDVALAAAILAADAPGRRTAAARARERVLADRAWERRAELVLGRVVPASRRHVRPPQRALAGLREP